MYLPFLQVPGQLFPVETVYIDNKENDASGINVINNCGFSNTANDQQIKKIHSRTATVFLSGFSKCNK
jgi:HrpA-like RNA helicase